MSKIKQLLNGIRKDCLNAVKFSDKFEYSETSRITIYNDDTDEVIELEYQYDAENDLLCMLYSKTSCIETAYDREKAINPILEKSCEDYSFT